MNSIEYFSLIRKCDSKEVYTSIAYKRDDCNEVLDWEKIIATLNFYFDRVNSAIKPESGNKPLNKADYEIYFKRLTDDGGWSSKIIWKEEAQKRLG